MSELTGGIKNAMERKEPVEKIRRSFINAGYSPQEVEQALQEANSIFSAPNTVQVQKPTPVVEKPKPAQPVEKPTVQQPMPPQPSSSQFNQLPSTPQVQTKKEPHIPLLAIGILCALILLGAAMLGIYWDQITGLFK